ncbi:PE-PPE domain-containing protein [Mycobacterium sp. pV006]|uniref:PE-PPE domain-containing protein n=1 Tax=Mycobacterium sp. pV006 TaxID=3238983 RepID=UPI00351B58AB
MYRIGVFLSVILLGVFSAAVRGPSDGVITGLWQYAMLADETPKPTALIIGGKGGYAELSDEQMRTAFGGLLASYERVNVPFPGDPDFGYSIGVGADNLYDAVKNTSGVMLIGAVSQGAPTVPEVLRRLMDDPDRPLPGELTAMVYSYPVPLLFLLGGARYVPFPETPYDILNISAEYDGISDFPDNWFNILAVVNAIMGGAELHVDRAFFDVRTQPTRFVEVTNDLGGTTTYVLIPTPRLPLLTPWVEAGFPPEFIDFMDALLRPIIDSAYIRPRMEVGVPEILKPPPITPPETPAPPVSAPLSVEDEGAQNRIAAGSGDPAPVTDEAPDTSEENSPIADGGGIDDGSGSPDPTGPDIIDDEDIPLESNEAEIDGAETGGAVNEPPAGEGPDEQAEEPAAAPAADVESPAADDAQ